VNNRVAEIKVIQKLPWAEPSVAVSEYGAVTVTWTIHFEQVGIVLNVTPTITDDGRIAMDIKPDVSEKTADFTLTVTDPNGKAIPYTVPIIDSRTANTKVIVGNGQTFIIGGLMKETTTDGSTKVPVLGDIPGLGWMFKNNKKTKEKTELLIFVSPTIITPSVMQRMADRSEVYSPAKNVPAAGDEKERAVKSKPPRDLEVLKIDKDRWKKVLSSVNSLESKVEDLTANRENLERQIRINN
jgi:type II secretory pathway component GspD/PulD (secretin)